MIIGVTMFLFTMTAVFFSWFPWLVSGMSHDELIRNDVMFSLVSSIIINIAFAWQGFFDEYEPYVPTYVAPEIIIED